MSRIARAQELAKKVLGTNRNLRNQEIKMDRMLPNRAQNLAETVLKTPSPRPGGLVAAGQAMRGVGRRLTAPISPLERGLMAGGIGTGIGLVLSETDPNDLGKSLAKIDQPFYELMGQVQEKASDLAQIPQVYFMQVKQAYDDERQRQQEMQNIQEFGTFEEPEFIPESGEIKPVSVFMAGGGPFNVREILGESSRTLSNKQLEMLTPRDRAKLAGMSPAMGSPMYDDNEPRFEDRSPENQIFSIDTAISNLMSTYDMVVRNKEFERAQMIADQIDQLQQQKIGIQAQNDPQTGFLSNINTNIREMMGESGKTISNQDRETISSLLDSISQ